MATDITILILTSPRLPENLPKSSPPGETVVYDINLHIRTISAASFNFLSEPGGGTWCLYKSAAHIQGIGNGGGASGSDWNNNSSS